LPQPEGADVRFIRGPVGAALPTIRAAADGSDIWVVGGGDLAGQFLDAGALDQIDVSIAPVTLAGGAPLLPRHIESSQMRLLSTSTEGQFVHAVYAITYPGCGGTVKGRSRSDGTFTPTAGRPADHA
jgi:dihydrofolate reductase